MRVLFLTHSYPRRDGDAAGNFLLHLATALAGEGVEVRTLAPSGPGLAPREVVGGIPVTRFRYAPSEWETLAYTGEMAQEVRRSLRGKLAMGGFLASGVATLRREVHDFRPDVLHAHWWFPAGMIATFAPGLGRLPLVTTMHGTDVRLAVATPAVQGTFRRVMARSAACTTVSQWLAEQVRAIAPACTPVVAPMPVSPSLFHPGDARTSDRLLFVGRLNAQKGIGLLLEALASVRAPLHLDVVGGGPDADALRGRAESLGIAGRIVWHGPRTQQELAPFYRHAAALVVPSIGEGLGLVAVEAQLSGTPVIAFASGGIVDVVSAERTGLLVPAGDVAALAAALDRVADDPGLRETLGMAGRAAAMSRFAPGAAAKTYAEIYRHALAR